MVMCMGGGLCRVGTTGFMCSLLIPVLAVIADACMKDGSRGDLGLRAGASFMLGWSTLKAMKF